jgi:cytochrome b561
VAAINVVESGASTSSGRGLWLALPLWAVGIAGLLRDSWPGAQHLAGVNLHAIFGALLWLMVVVQFSHASFAGPPLSSADVHALSRRLSRRIYLLLFVLFGVCELVRLAAFIWNDGAQGALHPAVLPAPENLRDYFAYGVFALLTIHVLAAAQCHALNRVVAR